MRLPDHVPVIDVFSGLASVLAGLHALTLASKRRKTAAREINVAVGENMLALFSVASPSAPALVEMTAFPERPRVKDSALSCRQL